MTRILIVDDKEENVYYLRALLTGHGYTVESACHGAEALVKARPNPPDLVISDLLMPIMDGYTLLRHWKADERLKKIPFIVYTATYTEEEDEKLALSLGADAFILKPSEPEDFLARVREVQANAAASAPTPSKFPAGDEKALLKVYSETLIRKLEERTLQLEEANRALQKDNAERRAVELELRESEARYRTLFECAPDGILIADPGSTYLDANASMCRMLGYARAELIGLHARDIVVPEEVPQIESALGVIGSRVDYHREWRFQRKDRSTFSAEVIATQMPDGNLLAMIRDVTERNRTEARFHRLVDSNAQGVMFWNTKGEITGANDAFLRIVGYSRADLESRRINWAVVTPPEYADLDRRALAEIVAAHVCTPYEKEYLRKDSSRAPVLVGAATFEDNPEEGFCFVLDLTERKALEQQFLRVQRMESIGTLAGGIAHDLNNVLGPIIMSLELLNLKFTDASSQELVSMIASSAHRGAAMVSQVLSFARGVEGQRVELQLKHVIRDLEKIANDTFLKNIEVRTIIADDLWTILGDPTQLHQVLLNLCVNARDAMPNGGKLTISAENLTIDAHYAGMALEARPGPYVLLQVEDSGSGMPPEIMEKIFDPFFTTKEVGKGTGLGLSTTLGIVKSHSGFIQTYSEPGKGTTFKVCFPARTEASADPTAPISAELPRGNGELILVIDDETTVREITRQTLEAFGYRVILAPDGAEAVAIFAGRSAEIGAVITDIMMPIMDGTATIRVLQRMNPQVPIIAASGLTANAQLAQLTSLGVKHFLAKPYTAATLLATLRRVLVVH